MPCHSIALRTTTPRDSLGRHRRGISVWRAIRAGGIIRGGQNGSDFLPRRESILLKQEVQPGFERHKEAGWVNWKGPVGMFEYKAFNSVTQAIADLVAACEVFTQVGGGDSTAAIERFHVADCIDYISMAGGVFLAYVDGKKRPALEAHDT